MVGKGGWERRVNRIYYMGVKLSANRLNQLKK